MLDEVTVVIVTHNTLHLVSKTVNSFRSFYPGVSMLLIDNASKDGSTKYIRSVASRNDNVDMIKMYVNIGHGPAMHIGFETANTRYVFTLDSDTETIKDRFIEKMLYEFATNPRLYAIGWLRMVNGNGVSAGTPKDPENYTRYIHPYAAMWDRKKYFSLPSFEHTGAPCNRNMAHVKDTEWVVQNFPIKDYVKHLIAGTRRMWGGSWEAKGAPSKWSADRHYPI